MPRAAILCLALVACSSAGASTHGLVVAPAPPPRDDGKPAQGGKKGQAHAAALEQLKVAPLGARVDKQNSLRIMLPDAEHWMRVKFMGVKSLVGFRYGKDHHAIVAGFVTHVEDSAAPGACESSFEDMAKPWIESFEVDIEREEPHAVAWRGRIADIDAVTAKTATLFDRDQYAVAYGAYPAWQGACLVVGVAVPAREELERAKQVRDRFVREVLPKIEVLSVEEPKERY
jgi:hypothetical protein